MHLSSASNGGDSGADMGTLLIVHFKVLVFPQLWGKSPVFGTVKHPTGFEDMHFRTLFWFFEQLANTQTLHSDEN